MQKLDEYKRLIDEDIAKYSILTLESVLNNFGKNSAAAISAYLEILNRSSKRIRGSLTIVGYKICGGQDTLMVIQAARIIEMVHAYILIMDDINDRSKLRRGGSSAHVLMSEFHKKHQFLGEHLHFGESIAMNSALAGNHAANMVLSALDVSDELKVYAFASLNYAMTITAHGQINDIFNGVRLDVNETDVKKVQEWKTAYYTFLNPLTFGMVLAGADCSNTDSIREYSLAAGQVFQTSDDILGIFGDEQTIGKSPLDDIREGKKTLLIAHATSNSTEKDKKYLLKSLGNQKLTLSELENCQKIIKNSGSLEFAQNFATTNALRAKKELKKASKKQNWPKEQVVFLNELIEHTINRKF